jgi:hypothetical protein
MSDPKKLPFLIKLLDDESTLVKESVKKELIAFGPALEEELQRLNPPPDRTQKNLIQDFVQEGRRETLKNSWSGCLSNPNPMARLEQSMSLISDFLGGTQYPFKLGALLDGLAEEYSATHCEVDVYRLSEFLFQKKSLRGAISDYYNPQNSSLISAIEKKSGLPISLALIYILVGTRLGLNIEGCNLPGHFMAKVRFGNDIYLIDCFDGGRFVEEKNFLIGVDRSSARIIREIIRKSTPPEAIISRVLTNLMNAYHQLKSDANYQLMAELKRSMEKHLGVEEV